MLNNIPQITRIILPNLRIIRGRELVLESGLFIVSVNATEIILPKLTEISEGGITIIATPENPLCNLALVNWADIVDNGRINVAYASCKQQREFHYDNELIITQLFS